MRLTRFPHIVDLNRVDELRHRAAERHPHDPGDDASGGGRARHRRSMPSRSSPRRSRTIGHFQIRNRGTVGGSIAHADPASELPAVALALDAELEIAGAGGAAARSRRRLLRGHVDHVDRATTRCSPRSTSRCGRAACGFVVDEVARRSGDFALTGVVCGVELDDSGAVAALGDRVLRHGPHAGARPRGRGGAERVDAGRRRTCAEIARLAVADCNPSDDVHASAEYRKHVGAHLAERALDRALGEARSG